MFFSVITKNSNWEILPKNLVTFQRWDGIKDEKLKYLSGSLKTLTFSGKGGGSRKTNIEGGGLPKKGGFEQFANLMGWIFSRGGGGFGTSMHTMGLD